MKSARSSLLWEIYKEHCRKAPAWFLKSCVLRRNKLKLSLELSLHVYKVIYSAGKYLQQ